MEPICHRTPFHSEWLKLETVECAYEVEQQLRPNVSTVHKKRYKSNTMRHTEVNRKEEITTTSDMRQY